MSTESMKKPHVICLRSEMPVRGQTLVSLEDKESGIFNGGDYHWLSAAEIS